MGKEELACTTGPDEIHVLEGGKKTCYLPAVRIWWDKFQGIKEAPMASGKTEREIRGRGNGTGAQRWKAGRGSYRRRPGGLVGRGRTTGAQ